MSAVVQGTPIAEKTYENGTHVVVTDAGQKLVTLPGQNTVVTMGPGRAAEVPVIETPPPNLQATEPDPEPFESYTPTLEDQAAQAGSPFIAEPVTDPLKAVAESAAIPALQSSVDLEVLEVRFEQRLEAALEQQREAFDERLAALQVQQEAAADVADDDKNKGGKQKS